MITEQLTQDQLIAMLAWQVEMGADEAVLDKPSCDLQDSLLFHDTSAFSSAPSACEVSHRISPQSVTKSSSNIS